MVDNNLHPLYQIFMPNLVEQLQKLTIEDRRLVHYTTASTAKNIIENEEVWLRNALVMNDFSEISYGLKLIRSAAESDAGKTFEYSISKIYPNVYKEVMAEWHQSELEILSNTYIACLSLHEQSEDENGRLSMWHAYGNTALVLNNTPFTNSTDKLGVYTLPVMYLYEEDYQNQLVEVSELITKNSVYLRNFSEKDIYWWTFRMFLQVAIGTKHPGFSEEKEWRVYYNGTGGNHSGILTKKTPVIDGTPQEIWSIRLTHDPQNGLYGADIQSFLHKIIIGPSQFPYIIASTLANILHDKGVEEPQSKVAVSDIPLRAS